MAKYWQLLKQAYADWSEDEAMRLGAALAYYTIFSIAPLLIVVIAVVGLVFGEAAARGQVVAELESLIGADAARTVEDMIERTSSTGSGTVATVLGLFTLFLGATGVVTELKTSMNKIWEVEQASASGVKGMVKQRITAFAVVLGIGFLLLVSLVVSAALATAGTYFEQILPLPEAVLLAANFAVSFGVITVLFALLFKFLPDVEIAWSDVWKGAAVTALLFVIGKVLLGMYIGKAGVASAYGAAGSLVVLLVWVYYSAQIFFFGAEFTQVYANTYGSRIRPDGAPAGPRRPEDREALPARRTASVEARPTTVRSGVAADAGGGLAKPPGKMAAMGGLAIAAGVLGLRFWNRFNGKEQRGRRA